MNEGILVTTSNYGRDSYEFAKDKPITFLNGENLLHLLQEDGAEHTGFAGVSFEDRQIFCGTSLVE